MKFFFLSGDKEQQLVSMANQISLLTNQNPIYRIIINDNESAHLAIKNILNKIKRNY